MVGCTWGKKRLEIKALKNKISGKTIQKVEREKLVHKKYQLKQESVYGY